MFQLLWASQRIRLSSFAYLIAILSVGIMDQAEISCALCSSQNKNSPFLSRAIRKARPLSFSMSLSSTSLMFSSSSLATSASKNNQIPNKSLIDIMKEYSISSSLGVTQPVSPFCSTAGYTDTADSYSYFNRYSTYRHKYKQKRRKKSQLSATSFPKEEKLQEEEGELQQQTLSSMLSSAPSLISSVLSQGQTLISSPSSTSLQISDLLRPSPMDKEQVSVWKALNKLESDS